MDIQIETPALLFSATSLILLAYTNRFLAIAGIVRSLKAQYDEEKKKTLILQIQNLKLRIKLIRWMQLMGVLSLFLSVFSMLFLFLKFNITGIVLFSSSLLTLLVSLALSLWEISISVKAINYHLSDLEK